MGCRRVIAMHRVTVIDSHTGGEPTRVVVAGGPDLGSDSLVQRREIFRQRFDDFRSAIVNEPRGNDAIVGALLCTVVDSTCAAGVIFFNNVGVLNMCGHGTIGLMVTLAYANRIRPGEHRIETPVGVVNASLHNSHRVTLRNVPSYQYRKDVAINVEGLGRVLGDIAWGGNWFFLVKEHKEKLEFGNVDRLTDVTWRIRQSLQREHIAGADGELIDHIELFGPSAVADSKNFVLCPGKAYDRSPCGTGTSAKLACLYADGKLKLGDVYRQESITGSIFEGSVEVIEGKIFPLITGSAYVTG